MDEIELLRTHISKLKKIVEDKDMTIKKLREELALVKHKQYPRPKWAEMDS